MPQNLLSMLAFIWQLPQNLVGFIVKLFYETDNTVAYKNKVIQVCKSFPGGISLGNTIIVKRYPITKITWDTVKHEYGHSIQSLYLGPLYLIVIGLPSLIWAGLHGNIIRNKDYYWFYTERWADKLGNVKR